MLNFKCYKSVKGFTLIELILVVFIVSILAAITVSVIPDKRNDILREATELLRLQLEAGRSSAIIEQRMWGVSFSDTTYQFLSWNYSNQKWQVLESSRDNGILPAGFVTLNEVLEFDLTVTTEFVGMLETVPPHEEGRAECYEAGEVQECLAAKVVIYPDGRMNEFDVSIVLKNSNFSQKVFGKNYSKVMLSDET